MLSSLNSLSRLGHLGLPAIPEETDVKGEAVAQQDASGGSSSGVWNFLKAATDAATTVYGNTIAVKQPQPVPVFTKAPTDYSKLLLYGGVAVVGVGALLYFTRRKRR